MKYQVIAFDLDGTLLNSQGQILTSNKIMIQRCIDKGLKVILVTEGIILPPILITMS